MGDPRRNGSHPREPIGSPACDAAARHGAGGVSARRPDSDALPATGTAAGGGSRASHTEQVRRNLGTITQRLHGAVHGRPGGRAAGPGHRGVAGTPRNGGARGGSAPGGGRAARERAVGTDGDVCGDAATLLSDMPRFPAGRDGRPRVVQ
nr:MAG: hypothetical protein DIU58_00770 [Sphaerobacter thermophilus]